MELFIEAGILSKERVHPRRLEAVELPDIMAASRRSAAASPIANRKSQIKHPEIVHGQFPKAYR
jgi:hypothetical protein